MPRLMTPDEFMQTQSKVMPPDEFKNFQAAHQEMPAWKQAIAKYGPPIAKGLGAGIGAFATAPANILAPGVASMLGAGAGYVGGGRAESALEQMLGMKHPTTTEELKSTVKDLPGAGMAALGTGAATAASRVAVPIAKAALTKGILGKILGIGSEQEAPTIESLGRSMASPFKRTQLTPSGAQINPQAEQAVQSALSRPKVPESSPASPAGQIPPPMQTPAPGPALGGEPVSPPTSSSELENLINQRNARVPGLNSQVERRSTQSIIDRAKAQNRPGGELDKGPIQVTPTPRTPGSAGMSSEDAAKTAELDQMAFPANAQRMTSATPELDKIVAPEESNKFMNIEDFMGHKHLKDIMQEGPAANPVRLLKQQGVDVLDTLPEAKLPPSEQGRGGRILIGDNPGKWSSTYLYEKDVPGFLAKHGVK